MPPNSIIPDESRHASSSRSVIVLVIVFILLVGVSVYMYKTGMFRMGSDGEQKNDTPQYTEEKVVVTGADLSDSVPVKDKIPAAFSKDIPLAKDAIVIESLTTDYPEKNMSLSNFTYTTALSAAEVFALYEPYFTKNGYVSGKDAVKKNEYITGVKNNDDFGVIIGNNGKNTVVNVSFLDRR